MFNKVVQGWINYYGRFYKSGLYPTLRHLNEYLVRWARRKYQRLYRHARRAKELIASVGAALREVAAVLTNPLGGRPA